MCGRQRRRIMSDELDRAIAEVTKLAGVPEAGWGQFRRLLLAVIDEANTFHEAIRNVESSAADIAPFLHPVITAARKLDTALARLQSDISKPGERSAAALKAATLLQTQLVCQSIFRGEAEANWSAELERLQRHEHTAWLAEYRHSLARLIPEARRGRGRPKGQFSWFVRRLYQIVKETGARRWTHHKAPGEPRWNGTLMRTLQILRPFLPSKGFFPENLGRSLEHLLKLHPEWRAGITT
jgi:hypothetical protein